MSGATTRSRLWWAYSVRKWTNGTATSTAARATPMSQRATAMPPLRSVGNSRSCLPGGTLPEVPPGRRDLLDRGRDTGKFGRLVQARLATTKIFEPDARARDGSAIPRLRVGLKDADQ